MKYGPGPKNFEMTPDVAGELNAYLLRPLGDKEAGLGAEIIALLMGKGIDAEAGELAILCAVCIWAEQRRLSDDPRAIQRMADNALNLHSQGRFRLKAGQDFVRMVQTEIEAGRRTLDVAVPQELEPPAPANGKVIFT